MATNIHPAVTVTVAGHIYFTVERSLPGAPALSLLKHEYFQILIAFFRFPKIRKNAEKNFLR